MRWTVSFVCGLRIACGVALALLNRRYAACVLAQSPHASLIGEPGDFASCPAVLIKRRLRRLSDRSTLASSCCTHSTECVPASIMACTSESAPRALFGTPPNTSRRTQRHGSNYQTAPTVSSFFYAALSLGGQSLIVVCNRQKYFDNRKSWLFCWTELGAKHVGIIQSLIVTCRLHGIDPYTYLIDVLQRVSQHPASRVAELTPRLWKTLFADNPLRSIAYRLTR